MKVFVVNAFTSHLFGGNPAAVVPLKEWLPAEKMQLIAAQHNLAETAFIVPQGNDFGIRWFTPTVEVDLCGHATLATAHVYFQHLDYASDRINFHSNSGILRVSKQEDGQITLDFPATKIEPIDIPYDIIGGFRTSPLAVFKSSFDYMAVFENEQTIKALSPDFEKLARIPGRGVIATAKGDEADFVSRCFYPQSGINEDPVTGSAHTLMTPYWAVQLGKNKLKAVQLSARKGWLDCEWAGDRVLMSGQAITYLEGDIHLG